MDNLFIKSAENEFFEASAEEGLTTRLKIKSVQEDYVGNVLHNDNTLYFPVQPNAYYEFEAVVLSKPDNYTDGFKFVFTVPTGTIGECTVTKQIYVGGSAPTMSYTFFIPNDIGTTLTWDGGVSNNYQVWIFMEGKIQTGDVSGTLQFQWSNKDDAADNVTVGALSFMTITKTNILL